MLTSNCYSNNGFSRNCISSTYISSKFPFKQLFIRAIVFRAIFQAIAIWVIVFEQFTGCLSTMLLIKYKTRMQFKPGLALKLIKTKPDILKMITMKIALIFTNNKSLQYLIKYFYPPFTIFYVKISFENRIKKYKHQLFALCFDNKNSI